MGLLLIVFIKLLGITDQHRFVVYAAVLTSPLFLQKSDGPWIWSREILGGLMGLHFLRQLISLVRHGQLLGSGMAKMR